MDDYEKMLKQRQDRQHENQIRICGIGSRFIGETFETYIASEENIESVEKIKVFSDNPVCGTLLIYGNVGLGKTHLGSAILHRCIFSPKYVSMRDVCIDIQVSRSFSALRNTKEVLDSYAYSGILIVDEIGRGSDKTDEQLFLSYVLNKRYDEKLPSVLITNMDWKSFKELVGENIIDRLRETGISIELKGESYRAKKESEI